MQSELTGSLSSQGLELAVFGMGTVFIFLSLLIFATLLMSRLTLRYFPTPAPQPKVDKRSVETRSDDDSDLLAIISSAVRQHRSKS